MQYRVHHSCNIAANAIVRRALAGNDRIGSTADLFVYLNAVRFVQLSSPQLSHFQLAVRID